MPLLDDDSLERSPVVANCAMNRERRLPSYAKELGVDPLRHVLDLARSRGSASWLDLCCGSGRALIEAAETVRDAGLADRVEVVGVDLVDAFRYVTLKATGILRLEVASVSRWEPGREFDLVTCVHGLHYVGDKLGALVRAASWLKPKTGLLVANLDPKSVVAAGAGPRAWSTVLRRTGFHVDSRRKLVSLRGRKVVETTWRYLGADDTVGPNYTGQAAVSSHYEVVEP